MLDTKKGPHGCLWVRDEEKIVELLVYSSFKRVSTSMFRKKNPDLLVTSSQLIRLSVEAE